MTTPTGTRDLRLHSKRAYSKGGSRLSRVTWVAFGQPLVRSIYCPKGIRVAILRAFGAKIGEGVLIRHDVKVHWPWKLQIGDNSWIGVGVWILNPEEIRIGHDVCISQDVLLCSGSHDVNDPAFESDNAPIVIGDGVWLAIRATVLRGVTVEDGAVVGATALVTRNLRAGVRVFAPSVNLPRQSKAVGTEGAGVGQGSEGSCLRPETVPKRAD